MPTVQVVSHVGPLTRAAIVWWLAFVGWQIFEWGGAGNRTAIGDLAPLPLEAAAVLLAMGAAKRVEANARLRRAWQLVALAFLLYFAGDVIWSIFEVGLDESPFPSVADVAYLAFYPVFFAGLLLFPLSTRTRAENIRLALDIGIVALSGGMAVWYFVLGPTVHDAASFDLQTVLSIAYPVGDLILILGIATVLLRGVSTSAGWSLRFLMFGVVSFVVADVTFGAMSLAGTYDSGDVPDTFWMLAILAFVAASEHQRRAGLSSAGTSTAGPATLRVSLWPYLAIAGAYGLMLAVSRTTAEYPLDDLLLGAFALTAIVVARQLTALKDNIRLMEEFRRLASTDALTGLVSRRHFHELAQDALEHARDDGRPLAALMVDLDHFKEVNDTYGHSVGDDVLRWVANRIQVFAPSDAIAGRYGGDELVAVIQASLDDALTFANELVIHTSSVARPVAGGPDTVSLSIGVASAAGCEDIETVLRCADSALYEAKRAGRNCARAHPELIESGDDDAAAALVERRRGERRRATTFDS